MNGLARAFAFRSWRARLAARLKVEHAEDVRAFLVFLSGYRRRILLAAGTMLLTVLFQLPLPFLTMWVVNKLVETRDLGIFPLVVSGLVALVVANGLVTLVHGLLVALLREHALATMEMDLVRHLQRLPVQFYYRKTSSYLATRIRSDLRNLNALLAGPLLNAAQSVLLFVGAVASMFVLSWRLAVVTLVTLPPFVSTLVIFNRKVRERSRAVQERSARYGSSLQEGFSATPVIKAFGAYRENMLRLRESRRSLILAMLNLEVTGSLAHRLTYALGTVAPVLVLWYGAHLYLAGQITIGGFVAFQAFLGYLFGPIQGLLAQNVQVQGALVSLHRLMELLRHPPEASGTRLPPATNALRVERLSFAYEPSRPVLRGLDLEVEPGQTIGLFGTSGGGKTTLLRLLLRFHDPDEGRIRLDGVDVRELELEAYRSRFAVAFQEAHLWSGTIEENLRLGKPAATGDEIRRACEAAVAWDFVHRLPDGLHTVLGEAGMTLSAGQKVRLAIARALLREAPILLFDEPTSALDAETAERLIDSLGGYLAGRTAIIVSHQPAVLRIVDRAYLLDAGGCRPYRLEEPTALSA